MIVVEGQTFEVSTWRDGVLKTCVYVMKKKPNEFMKILKLKGRKRAWFALHPERLWNPKQIEGTRVWVETNMNSNNLATLCMTILDYFGFGPAIKFETD